MSGQQLWVRDGGGMRRVFPVIIAHDKKGLQKAFWKEPNYVRIAFVLLLPATAITSNSGGNSLSCPLGCSSS